MALYRKKLRGIKDLEREMMLLLKKKEELGASSFFSFGGAESKDAGDEEESAGGGLGSLLEMLPLITSVAGPVIDIVKNRVFSQREKKDDGEDKKKDGKKSFLYNIASEVIGGYLKWKAIELSVKGVRHILKKRNEKRSAEKQ